ncbi:MAG: ISKra4 family transposase [Acidobacteria bacterium]|nr:ISKra4 family transposase [Acidobacteriota bacterium]
MTAAASAALRPDEISDGPFRNFTLERARQEARDLEEWLLSAEAKELSLHELELEQEQRMREVNRLFLKAHIEGRGNGDVGDTVEVRDREDPKITTFHSQHRLHERKVKTIFGEIAIHRRAYVAPGSPSIHPLDESLGLPERSFSYTLQQQLAKAAVQGPFDEALERVEERTGVEVSKRMAEEIVAEVATDFEVFYEGRRITAAQARKTGPILVSAIDCKGIPMIKREQAVKVVRNGRGKKPQKKKMATVGTVFTQEPRVRTPEEVVQSLFEPESRKKVQFHGPENKRVWASLEKSKDELIRSVAEEMARRDPRVVKTWVTLADGERALRIRIEAHLGEKVIVILDLFHVLEKLWKAAYAFHAEGSDEAKQWVRERALRILRGEVSQVVKGMRQSATKRSLRGTKRKAVTDAASYFYKRRKYMKYDEYLAAGLPIASGSVEGACKNLIKDRMERSGMRWGKKTAEAILKLRAIYRSGDWDEYSRFHTEREHERLYPSGRWNPVVAK